MGWNEQKQMYEFSAKEKMWSATIAFVIGGLIAIAVIAVIIILFWAFNF